MDETKSANIKKIDINKISAIMGVEPGKKTVIKITPTEDENKKTLELIEGSWENKHPWFLVDENEDYYAMMPAKSLTGIISGFRETQEENFKLNLEKAILQNMPIDFEDVWVVAVKEIQELADQEGARITGKDMSEIVQKIKKKHPNLFFHISDLIAMQQPKKQ